MVFFEGQLRKFMPSKMFLFRLNVVVLWRSSGNQAVANQLLAGRFYDLLSPCQVKCAWQEKMCLNFPKTNFVISEVICKWFFRILLRHSIRKCCFWIKLRSQCETFQLWMKVRSRNELRAFSSVLNYQRAFYAAIRTSYRGGKDSALQ